MRKNNKCFWVSAVIVLIAVIAGVYFYKNLQNSSLIKAQDQIIETETQTIISLLDQLYKQYELQNMTLTETKLLAADILRGLRYGDDKKGYFFVDTFGGVNVVLYGNEKVEGKYRLNDTINGVAYVKELNKVALAGGGYVDYWYPKENGKEPLAKRAYAKAYKPFGWVIGTGYYLDDIK